MAILQPRDLAATRTAMRSLLPAAQSHLHFVKEKSARKSQIADVICGLPVQLDVYGAPGAKDQKQARRSCLAAVVEDLAGRGAHRLVIEQDDSAIRSDREVLYQAVRKHGGRDSLVYEHLPAQSDPLLWIPDAAAWCWTKNAEWRRRIQPLVDQVNTV